MLPDEQCQEMQDIILNANNKTAVELINLFAQVGWQTKSSANGCREGEETAFANWLA